VADTGRVTSIYHRWTGSVSLLGSIDSSLWDSSRRAILQRLDQGPVLLPAGSATHIADVRQQLAIAEHQRGEIRRLSG